MDVFPKFIIEDGRLIIGKVTYHYQLMLDKKDKSKVAGGGWFKWSEDKSTMIFYESSHDLGKASFEDVKKAVESKQVYSSQYSDDSIADEYKFGYDTGTEIIILTHE